METDNKNALMVQSVVAFTQGCAGTEISDEACAWFQGRYYAWLDSTPKNPEAKGQTPQQVWADHGKAFKGQFRKIGELAANAAKESSGTIDPATLEKHALAVERESDCPWCPDQ